MAHKITLPHKMARTIDPWFIQVYMSFLQDTNIYVCVIQMYVQIYVYNQEKSTIEKEYLNYTISIT